MGQLDQCFFSTPGSARTSEIYSELDKLDISLGDLKEILQKTTILISPVTRPDVPSETKECSAQTQTVTDLGAKIRIISNIVAEMKRQMLSVNDRIEL